LAQFFHGKNGGHIGMAGRGDLMGGIHEFASPFCNPAPTRRTLAILYAYDCSPAGSYEAKRFWHHAHILARIGYDVWVVSTCDGRNPTHSQTGRCTTPPNLRWISWDFPMRMGMLKRYAWGRWFHRWIWNWHVRRSIDDWQTALGMQVIHRSVLESSASITYLAQPPGFSAAEWTLSAQISGARRVRSPAAGSISRHRMSV
jgi:hypothetical protein